MFQRCFCCFLPSCLPDVQPRTSLAVGFYTGTVHETGPEILLLSLFSSVTAEKELIYIVERKGREPAKPGDVAFVLKMEESELVTVPATMNADEIQCTIVSISSNYVVLRDSITSLNYVFPYTHFLKDPLKYISKPACLARIADQYQYDVIIEEERPPRLNISEPSSGPVDECGLKSPGRRGSLRPSGSSLTSPIKFPGRMNEDEIIVIEPADTRSQNAGNPFVIKEEPSSSFMTLEGDSGEFLDISPESLPQGAALDAFPDPSPNLASAKAFNRVLVSPYPKSNLRRSIALPDMIGKHRLPLHLLKQPGVSDRQIERIGDTAVAWRCSEPDGGSFFRCVAVAWLEHLARMTTPIVELDSALSLLQSPPSPIPVDFLPHAIITLETLQNLHSSKTLNRQMAVIHLQKLFQQKEVIMGLERYVRMICSEYMDRLSGTPDLGEMIMENIGKQKTEIEGEGMEFSGLTYTAVAETLSISLSIMSLSPDSTVSMEEFQPDECERTPPSILLLHQDDHFHLLYTREELSVDGYDMDSHCFEVLESSLGGDQTTTSVKA